MSLAKLKETGEAPHWLTEEGYKTILGGYLLKGETPKAGWERVCKAAADILNRPDLEKRFFDLVWKNWLGLATPVFANMGTDRGLPISCFAAHVPDTTIGIFQKNTELALLSKYGGGVALYYGDVRGRGATISKGGQSEGIMPWIKVNESTTLAVSQSNMRRGAAAVYLPIWHSDIREFLRMRRAEGDPNRQSQHIHHGVCIDDKFMQLVESGDSWARELLTEIYKTRLETGEPYIFFSDSVNQANPQCYKDLGLSVVSSNICSEICLTTDPNHTFVCCLSSLNLARWEEWRDTDAVYLSILFLDAVMEEFIQKASKIGGFEAAVRFAQKSRALGLGVMGWHTLLQSENTPVDSLRAKLLNKSIFRRIQSEAIRASEDLAKEYGEPEWLRGYGRRNSHLLALAPTVSNATISGNVSPSIEILPSNTFTKNTAKGNFVQYNQLLKTKLASLDKDSPEIWKKIIEDGGSVRSLSFLDDLTKEVFKTAFEIDQNVLVDLAAERQKYICQGQSLNLFFHESVDPKYFHEVHWNAWKKRLKTLYYTRTSSVLKADMSSRESCRACEG